MEVVRGWWVLEDDGVVAATKAVISADLACQAVMLVR
jgi:hypothetical protein